jgi:hypothetical protein
VILLTPLTPLYWSSSNTLDPLHVNQKDLWELEKRGRKAFRANFFQMRFCSFMCSRGACFEEDKKETLRKSQKSVHPPVQSSICSTRQANPISPPLYC